jgi:hypothetical protein
MKEILINGYLKIEPVEQDSFMASDRTSYEEVGTVVSRDEYICSNIPIGARVYFDSFMAKKYPVKGEFGKFQWFIHVNEVVKFEYEYDEEQEISE